MVELYFFSFTGNCKKVAEWIAEHLGIEAREIISPKLPYPVWLFLSFIPCIGIRSKFRKPEGEKIILCFPKWTLNCPPVTYFLKKCSDGRELYLIICYGGFDEKRYAKFYCRFLQKRARSVEYLLVRRKMIKENPENAKKIIFKWLQRI
ncbi:flavodoxin family protein [Archaeoglobus neptunius]|uniref:flavodoxin family protein n=1 Tax=Archaeoglobus neptunius TaxID=2798580 RepID=UPI001926083F|nr:flavodoxin family protein [Archaeoglobus neptunius]